MQQLSLLLLLVCAVAQVGAKSYSNYKLIKAIPKNKQQLLSLKQLYQDEESELDFWIPPSTLNRTSEFLVPPAFVAPVKSLLNSLEVESYILSDNIQEAIDQEHSNASQNISQYTSYRSKGVTDKYATYEEIVALLKGFAAKYSHAKMIHFGQSFEGRPLYAIKFSTGPGKKAVFVESGMHCREWISIASSLKVMERMATTCGSNSEVDELLGLYDWIFVPTVNPDGYHYTHNYDRMWRKNRRPINFYCVGTDINRNFDAGWGGPGASPNPCNPTYRGTSMFSEPETRALVSLVKSSGDLVAFFSVHAYSQYILTPYGYTRQKPADSAELTELAQEAAKAIKAVNGLEFTVGTPPELLYIATGGAYDWAKLKAGIKYAYAFELRPTQGYGNGFLLPMKNILPSSLEFFAALKAFAKGFK